MCMGTKQVVKAGVWKCVMVKVDAILTGSRVS